MNSLVRLTTDESGQPLLPEEQKVWHLTSLSCGEVTVLCSADFFWENYEPETVFTKETKRGGVTCPACIAIVKSIKSVRL